MCPVLHSWLEAAFESGWVKWVVESVKTLHSLDLAQESTSEDLSFEYAAKAGDLGVKAGLPPELQLLTIH